MNYPVDYSVALRDEWVTKNTLNGKMGSKSRPTTVPTGFPVILPSALTRSTATWDHDPGAAPQSTTVNPGRRILYLSSISQSFA